MSDSGVVQNGYQIKRVASTAYKIIKSTRHEEDFPKGKNEAFLGQERATLFA